MRIFECSRCHHAVFFESVRCVHCDAVLAYLPDLGEVHGMEPIETLPEQNDNEQRPQPLPDAPVELTSAEPANSDAAGGASAPLDGDAAEIPSEQSGVAPLPKPSEPPPIIYRDIGRSEAHYKLCANSARFGVCNAALPADSHETLCEACRLNTIIPDLDEPGALEAWQAIERAKRRLIYTLHALKLPIGAADDDLPVKLTFSFMSDSPDGTKVLTGHDAGHITLNIAEADAPFREKLRQELGEGYRTLLGHFRHEIGHFYWDALVKDSAWLEAFRAHFGDESADYGEALKRHYESGPPFKWHERYVSAYATMHPWEDWAETWAHYLHIVDTLDTARAYGVSIQVDVSRDGAALSANPSAVHPENFAELLAAWVPLTVTLNSLNRSMGLADPYPFVLSEAIARKLQFVHDVIYSAQQSADDRANLAQGWLERASHVDHSASLLPGTSEQAEQQTSSPLISDQSDAASPDLSLEVAS